MMDGIPVPHSVASAISLPGVAPALALPCRPQVDAQFQFVGTLRIGSEASRVRPTLKWCQRIQKGAHPKLDPLSSRRAEPEPQGRQARRPAGLAADHVRVGHQS